MENTQPAHSETRSALVIALITLLSCWVLFYFDYETRSVADLFKPENLAALVVYFVPTFFITFFLFLKFRHKKSQAASMLLAFAIGVPISFALVIGCFSLFR